jgi:hypothetical protein
MPEPEMTFSQLRTVMETQMGFAQNEWLCLVGAHSLGRAMRSNTGYGGAWTTTSNTFDNQYYKTMNNDIWLREEGRTSTSEDVPVTGNEEFRIDTGAGTMMLKSDMAPYWDIETNPTCPVDHGATSQFCPPRTTQFNFLQTLQNIGTFFSCFNPAFVKLSEMGATGLRTPA